MSLPILTLGETLGLLRATTVGSLAQVSNLELGFGGAESNVAVALTRLGAPVLWLGRVGNDALGDRIVRGLRGEGVDVHAIVDDSAPTGVMLKAHRTPEATEVLYYRSGSAGSRLCAEDVDTVNIAGCSLLHITGITSALSDGAAGAVTHAIDRASAANVPISFDVNHRSRLWTSRDAATRYREIAARSTIVFAGIDEAKLLVPDAETPEKLARGIAAMGPSEVIIKLGERGAFALVDGKEYHRDAIPVHVLDTVGAGDGFVGGYLAERLRNADVEQRLTTAATTGAFACLNSGDWEGYPKRSELGLLGAEEPVTR
jgi:2-dehydro-3-deoxygluconokinase